MIYVYRDRILYLGNKRFLLEWCEGQPYIQNLDTLEKTNVEMLDISNFVWIKNKIKFHLKINRSTRKISKEKVWKKSGFKKPCFEDVEECECTVGTEKLI